MILLLYPGEPHKREQLERQQVNMFIYLIFIQVSYFNKESTYGSPLTQLIYALNIS